jgi:hypothetical protein
MATFVSVASECCDCELVIKRHCQLWFPVSLFVLKPALVLSTISSQHSSTVQLNLLVEYTQK